MAIQVSKANLTENCGVLTLVIVSIIKENSTRSTLAGSYNADETGGQTQSYL